MQTNLRPFNPNSWPCYPGIGLDKGGYVGIPKKEEDVKTALEELRLEDAKNAIYHCYGKNSYKTQEKLLLIVQKLVELNAEPLSDEHKKCNYSLHAAYSVGCNMYTISYNVKGYESKKFMAKAAEALSLVADCYAKKNAYCDAVDCLRRLDKMDSMGPLKSTFAKWESYIKKDCPTEDKARQEFLYQDRYKNL